MAEQGQTAGPRPEEVGGARGDGAFQGEEPEEKPEFDVIGPEPPLPRLLVADVTVEKLGAMLQSQPRGTLMMRDELAAFINSMNCYKSGGGDRQFWIKAHGGTHFTVDRLSRDPVHIERLTVSVIGGIQPDPLANTLMRSGDNGGLLARFCPVFPSRVPVTHSNRVCGSGAQAVVTVAQQIAAGEIDAGVAGGMENMDRAPYLMGGGWWGYRMGPAQILDSMLTDGLNDAFSYQRPLHMTAEGDSQIG